MSTIITCQCGAKVRLPEATGVRLRCPRCKLELLQPVAAGELPTEKAHATIQTTNLVPVESAGTACPICQTAIVEGEARITCSDCEQVHHSDCWDEVGGCGTYGCKQAPELQKAAEPEETARSAWGDNKACPICGETIKAVALRCRYCGTDFDTTDPLSARDLHKRVERDSQISRIRREVTTIFVGSVIGFLAPLMLIIGLIYVPKKRAQIQKAGPVYGVLAYAALALSVLYSILMLIFWLQEQGGQ